MIVTKVLTSEQIAIALIIYRSHDWDMGQYTCCFTVRGLFSVRVPSIRHDPEAIDSECCFGSFGHRL
jgi:hypothetical protein